MKEERKRKAQLMEELKQLRQRVAELEQTETERKRAEETLTHERSLLHLLMDSIPDWIFFKDAKSRFIRVNRALAQLLGVADPQEAVGKTDFDFFPREDAQRFYSEEQKIIQSEQPVIARVGQTPNRDGEMLWVSETKIPLHDETGKVVGLVGISRDIAELKRVEEETKRAKDDYLSITNLTGDIIVKVDREGKWTFVNDGACQFWGKSREELIGSAFADYLHPDDQEKTRTAVEEVKSKKLVRGLVTRQKTPRGWRTVGWNGAAIFDQGGRYVGFEATGTDITERKKAEEALIQLEKLRALGEMAGGVAHDFNNLLAIILGNAQLLEKALKRYKAEEIKERLKIITRTAYEGGEIVRRLQHFTHTEVSSRDFTRIDLNEIVREAIASTSPRWKDETEATGITIKIREELGKLPPLLGSRSGLMEVLTNLIFNALEAMPEGGEITIRTEAKQNEIYLYFTDSGKGIPNRIKGKIFDPFFTTKGSQASGLGLSVSYGIIKRHQGKIEVDSTKGKGTTFTISIPMGLQATLKKEKLKEPEEISSRKILVIDDEEGVREVLGRIFQDGGHRVTLAETAKKGLEEFKQGDFDLVLTDLGMTEMSGWQLAKKIKEIDLEIPVGLITGWAVAITKKKMKEKGVDFIISKPFDLTKVLREVNAALKPKKR